MIIGRFGNKQRIAKQIIKYFPKDNTYTAYVEPFFGAGGMFLNKEVSQYNILNDIDNNIYNLFIQWKTNKDSLIKEIQSIPIHQTILDNYFPSDDISKAAIYILTCNYSVFGTNKTLRSNVMENKKYFIEERLNLFFEYIKYCKFYNKDFREFLKILSFDDRYNERDKTFIYADPPYLDTKTNYDSFTENDSIDLFDYLENSKCRYAISEFNHPFILKQAKQRNLNVIEIGERRNLGNRRTEILITNYETELGLFDSLGGASNTKSSLAFV